MNKIKVRCICCGGDLYFESGQQLVKCAFCGETMAVIEFDSELARMNAAIEEGEQAKRALAAAEQEKESAEKRLGQAMSSLEGIFTSQKNTDQALAKISRDFSKEKEAQKDMRELLTAVRGKVGGSQDMLSDLLKMVSKGQQDSGEKLASLQQLSETILQNQGNMFGALAGLSKITEKLDMNAQEQQKLAGDFMNWFQNLHKEDIQRLNAISSASSALLDGQKVLERKALQLQQAALDTQSKIDGFHQEYKRDKLEKLHALCQQAEQFQIDRQYDQAAERYLEVEANGGADAETCWRRILCHYCVFYQKNDDNEMVPIILNPDLSDPAQMSLRKELVSRLAPAGNEVRKHYEKQLAEIDKILDQYRQVRHETEYDVFISVKQTDDQRHYTKDGDKASDLYDFLASRGLRVFNSRRSLPAGEIYEPRIIGALMSARVMIVVGSSAENMDSNWVKNEWSRFQWLQRREKDSKRKLLCYLTGGMDPYQIPRGLNPDRQAIIDGISAHDALINALKDLIKTGDSKSQGIGTAVPNPAESVLNQMTVWLVTGEYQQVAEKYEQLKAAGTFLDQSKLHLLALCAEKKVSDIEQLIQSSCVLKEEPLFKAAFVMSGNMQERTVLTDYANRNDHYRDIRTAEAEKWFQQGEEAFKKKNSPLAASYYEKAAELGHVSAQFKLWNIYNFGQDGAGHDSIKAEYWLRKAAKQDHIPSMYYLAILLKGAGNKEAVYWAKKAAEQGSVPVQGLLASIYHEGKLVEKDEDQCRYWREKEASYIDPSVEMNEMSDLYQVRYNLAMDYQTGGRYGGAIDKDYERAAYWFGKAAEDTRTDNNSVRSKAFFELGKCYEEGIGVIKSSAAAIRNYEAAVNCATEADKKQGIDQKANERLIALRGKPAKNHTQSEGSKSVPEKAKNEQAQKKLSAEEWYQKHLKEDKAGNQAAAFECCMKAAQMGHAVAQNVVGWRYEVGKGTVKNDIEAFNWYKKAAENGNRIAQSNLGICYEYGRGVSKDLSQAVKWYRKAAENGWSKAQFKLGGFLEQGSGISMDIKKAAEWYQKAANQNYKGAAEKADELEGRIKNESKETSPSPETRKRLQEIETIKSQYPDAVIPDENTEIISQGKVVPGKVLVIPSWVREIEGSGVSSNKFFPGNSSLEELYILSDNCEIKPDAFTRCSNLKKVVISSSPMLKITDSFYRWNGRENASVSEKGFYIKKVADRITVDFKGRTDFSKINDALLRYKAGLCIKCGGEFGFLGKCKNCGEKRIK